MNVENDPLAWVKHAEEDYAAVQSSLRRKQPLTSIACFHAQQCAEKYLKAMRVRYPGDDPTPDEAREAFAIAKSVRRFARKFLNVT
jgi:HEPN domain-containing protein